jgi:hypothetical protein
MLMAETGSAQRQDFYCILDEGLMFDDSMMFGGELRNSLSLGNMPLDSLWLNTKNMTVARVVQIASAPERRNGSELPPQGLEILSEEECLLLRQNNTRFRCRYSRWENGNGRVLAQPVPLLFIGDDDGDE